MHLCNPGGDATRDGYARALEWVQADNRRVIRAMLDAGEDVPDTMSDWGLRYVPERSRHDRSGRPLMDVFGIYDMVERGTFSCGDAAGWEAAVIEEKYGIPAAAIPAPQGDNDFHAVVVTEDGVYDPTANFLARRKMAVRAPSVRRVAPENCKIGPDGRVACDVAPACFVDERGRWDCPRVPGVHGKREAIGPVQRSPRGQAWARAKHGAVVPVAKRANGAKSGRRR